MIMPKECVTHHHACDCREKYFADLERLRVTLEMWRDMSSAQMRLQCGELTAQEIRTVRAVLDSIIAEAAKEAPGPGIS